MKLKVVSFPKRHSRNYITKRVDGLLDLLSDRYEIERIETERYTTLDENEETREFRLKHSIIFELENGKFKMIEWDDRDNPIKYDCKEIVKSPNCLFVLKCQCSLSSVNPKIRPFFYFDKHNPDVLSDRLEELRSMSPVQKMYWRGNTHLGRKEVLTHLTDIVNDGWNELVPIETYWEEMASHKVALSLPGLGPACHREFEAFAVGTPVIMPVFRNRYHVPLEPDVHYIPIRVSKGYERRHPKVMAQKIREVYMKIINDDKLLSEVSRNAMRYYDHHIRYGNSLGWIKELLEL